MRQLMKSIGALAAVAVLAAGISKGAAHHSASMFDFSKTMTLKGSVVELRWVNPHVTLTLKGSLNPDEAPAEWLMETTSPGNLVRVGGWRFAGIDGAVEGHGDMWIDPAQLDHASLHRQGFGEIEHRR